MKKYLVCALFIFNECVVTFAQSIIVEGDIIHQSTTNQYCEESSTLNGNRKLTWKRTHVGSTAYPDEFCSDERGIIPHRDCTTPDNLTPGIWLEVTGNCSNNVRISNLTNALHQMLMTYAIHSTWDFELLFQISSKIEEFQCIDLYLLSKALYYMTIEEYIQILLDYFGRTMDNALDIYSKLNERCSNFNAATYILGAMNVFFNSIREQRNDLKRIIGRNFVLQVTNPFLDGITGLGLYNNEAVFFENYTIRPVLLGESYEDISLENLELAGYVPNDLITALSITLNEEQKSDLRIIIVVFRSSKLFDLGNDTDIVSRVIGFSISNFCNRKNDMLLDIYSKPLLSGDNPEYGEWFTINNNDVYSNYLVEDCIYTPVTYMFLYNKRGYDGLCRNVKAYPYAEINIQETKSPNSSVDFHDRDPVFDILSSLAVSINYAQPQTVIQTLYSKHQAVLRVLTVIGSVLSMFALLATVLTLIFVKNWYKKRIYTIQLKIAMAFQTFLFLVNSDISYVTYIVLYYFILSQFSWMIFIGYTQYLKFVKVFDDGSPNTATALVIGWLAPALLILIPILLYPDCMYCEFCPAKREILIYFVIIPTSLIILINISIYLLIMVSICRSKAKQYGGNVSKRQVRVGILLPFMFGITWIFVFALVSPWRWFSLTGSYLFHIIAPTQAFVLFIFVVVLDKNTRLAWITRWTFLANKLNTRKEITKDSADTTRSVALNPL